MPSPQALVRVREKNQITLPRDIVQALGVENTGYISYAVSPGEVTLRAIKTSPADKRAKIQRL